MSEVVIIKHRRYQPYGAQFKSQQGRFSDDLDNYILKAFKSYADEIDAKNDRYERIVKISRDINIESKRVIFLLHSIDNRKDNRVRVLDEAEQRLERIIKMYFCTIAKELQHQDIYKYRGAYTCGLQEFIEAYSLMEYMKYAGDIVNSKKQLPDWLQLQAKMCYGGIEFTSDTATMATEKYNFIIEPSEYILGVADLTGELMRRCIISLGNGETTTCLNICQILQKIYKGYMGLCIQRGRELSRKISNMRQNVLKAEGVCYNVKVRGSEAAKWGPVFDKLNDDDEGFF